MSTKGSASNLTLSAKDLAAEWLQTKDFWRDIKAMEFEEKYLKPLPEHMVRVLGTLEELDAILRKVRQDCE